MFSIHVSRTAGTERESHSRSTIFRAIPDVHEDDENRWNYKLSHRHAVDGDSISVGNWLGLVMSRSAVHSSWVAAVSVANTSQFYIKQNPIFNNLKQDNFHHIFSTLLISLLV